MLSGMYPIKMYTYQISSMLQLCGQWWKNQWDPLQN